MDVFYFYNLLRILEISLYISPLKKKIKIFFYADEEISRIIINTINHHLIYFSLTMKRCSNSNVLLKIFRF